MPYQLPSRPQLIAHRGFSGPYPENTRIALESAIALNVDMVEVDVRLSRDGAPVLQHNPHLDENSDGQGLIADYTLAQLRVLDMGAWKHPDFAGQRIITLDEALGLTKGRVGINLDIKTPAALPLALRTVHQLRMWDQVVFTGCTWPEVRHLRRHAPHVTVLLNTGSLVHWTALRGRHKTALWIYLCQARASGAAAINLTHHVVIDKLMTAARRMKLPVWTWTVDEPERARELAALGVVSITSNWPDRIRGVL